MIQERMALLRKGISWYSDNGWTPKCTLDTTESLFAYCTQLVINILTISEEIYII